MRDFSKVSPTVWRSKKFRSLSNIEARHVYLYLLTCPHGNSAGCFDLHPMYACADLGMTEIQYADCIDSLSKAGLIEWDAEENTVLITNWLEFNEPSNAKHAAGILSQLGQASSETLKKKAFQELRACIVEKKFDREACVRNGMQNFLDPIETVSSPRPRPDQDKTERETETREVGSRSPRPAAPKMGGGPTALEGRTKPFSQPPPGASPELQKLLESRTMKGAA
jgi:hypothetical protein